MHTVPDNDIQLTVDDWLVIVESSQRDGDSDLVLKEHTGSRERVRDEVGDLRSRSVRVDDSGAQTVPQLALGKEESAQLRHGQVLNPVVVSVNDDSEGVKSDVDSKWKNSLAGLDSLRVDDAAGWAVERLEIGSLDSSGCSSDISGSGNQVADTRARSSGSGSEEKPVVLVQFSVLVGDREDSGGSELDDLASVTAVLELFEWSSELVVVVDETFASELVELVLLLSLRESSVADSGDELLSVSCSERARQTKVVVLNERFA